MKLYKLSSTFKQGSRNVFEKSIISQKYWDHDLKSIRLHIPPVTEIWFFTPDLWQQFSHKLWSCYNYNLMQICYGLNEHLKDLYVEILTSNTGAWKRKLRLQSCHLPTRNCCLPLYSPQSGMARGPPWPESKLLVPCSWRKTWELWERYLNHPACGCFATGDWAHWCIYKSYWGAWNRKYLFCYPTHSFLIPANMIMYISCFWDNSFKNYRNNPWKYSFKTTMSDDYTDNGADTF